MKSLQTVSSGALRIARTAFSRQGLIFVSIAFAAVLAVPGVNSLKASAAPPASCPGGTLCLYRDINYGGAVWITFPSVGTCYNLTGWTNNMTSSYYSDLLEGRLIYFYDNPGCNSTPWVVNQAQGGHVAWIGDQMNDKISSFKVFN